MWNRSISVNEEGRRKLIPNSLGSFEDMYTYTIDIQYRYSNPKYELNFIEFKRQKPMDNHHYQLKLY